MLRYAKKSNHLLALRGDARDSNDDDERFFSPELISFKREARRITDLVAEQNSGTNWSFRTEDVQNDERESGNLISLMLFYSIRNINESIEIQREKEALLKTARTSIIAHLVRLNIEAFKLTPILALRFSYSDKKMETILYFNITDSKAKRNFFFDPLGTMFPTQARLLEKMNCKESLVCFPRDGSYDVDQRLGKVPLEFRIYHQRSPVLLSPYPNIARLFINIISRRLQYNSLRVFFDCLLYIVTYFGETTNQGNGRIPHYRFDIRNRSQWNDISPSLKSVIAFSSRCINAVALEIRYVYRRLTSSEEDENIGHVSEIELLLGGLKEGIGKIRDDNYPYRMTRDYIGSRINSSSCNKPVKDIISGLVSINVKNIILTDRNEVESCRPVRGDYYSLKRFKENHGNRPGVDGACDRPDWSLNLFLMPVHEIISLLLSGRNDVKVSKESDEAAEITKNDEIVCIILRIECEGGNFICIKYGSIDIQSTGTELRCIEHPARS